MYLIALFLAWSIKYSDLEDYMNPYLDKDYDKRFANIDGSIKRNPKYSLDYYSSYGSYLNMLSSIKSYNIYYCSLNDINKYLSTDKPSNELQNCKGDLLINGYLNKYFP